MLRKLVVVGVGLIGGSFARALRRAGAVGTIVGVDRNEVALARALELGIVDRTARDPADEVADADLVLLAAPVAQTPAILASIAARLGPDTVVTDAGSTKGDVVAAAQATLGARIARFVPAHPIAGREVHGPDAALADLYDGRHVIVTPLAGHDADAVERVRAAWRSAGARVLEMDVARHDSVLASVSHLPHVLAYALVAQIVDGVDAELKLALAGAGFRDFTRIAASSPEMWRDIVLANREALLGEIDRYAAVVADLRARIADGDGAGIEAVFDKASRTRLAWQAARDAATSR